MKKKTIMAILEDITERVSFANELPGGSEGRQEEIEILVPMAESLVSALMSFK